MGYMVMITLLFLSSLLCGLLFRNKNGIPTNWPLVGMLPALVVNIHRVYEFFIEVLEKTNMTFHFKGPWGSSFNLITTVDPRNIHYILSTNFDNYEKGSKVNELLEALGDGILNSDSTTWKYHKNVALSFLNHPSYQRCLVHVTWEKVRNGLLPLLEHVSQHKIEIDLKDIILRFMYDTMCTIMMSHDPQSISKNDLTQFPVLKAVQEIEQNIAYREVLPTYVWKFMRWLSIGKEKRHNEAIKILDDFIYKCINLKRTSSSSSSSKEDDGDQDKNNVMKVDLLTLFMDNKDMSCNNDKFLRDTIANFFLAGAETSSAALTWFFYLLSKNPQAVHKIKLELQENNIMKLKNENYYYDSFFIRNFNEISTKLIFLHAALCETLRLYPSVPFNIKTSIKPDVLPSGHEVTPSMQNIFCLYAMGRMKSLWGDDCCDFKPERWINEDAKLKHVSSSKFSAFSEGLRTCLGKRTSLTQMKIVAIIIIQNYDIEVIQGYQHVPEVSMVLHMKNEFKVKVHPSQ